MFANLLSVVFLVALSARSVVAADCTKTYTVKDGDYCDQISRQNNVSTFQLAALNAGKFNTACTDLAVGAVLCLATSPDQDCISTYTVVAGDTCDAISSAAGTNNTILYHNNPQIDQNCYNIYVGEVLCTANTVQVPPVPQSGVVVPVTGPPANSAVPSDNSGTPTPAPTPTALTVSGVDGYNAPTPSPSPLSTESTDENLPFCDEI